MVGDFNGTPNFIYISRPFLIFLIDSTPGGDMFLRSAAPDTLQGRAIQQVNETWGALHMKQEEVDDILNKRRARGRSYKGSSDLYIGIPVCKKKYTPFQIKRSV